MNSKAIILSGGGDKGAFTIGIIKKLLEQGNNYDIISGTSTGALIAPLLAIGEIERLRSIYTQVKKSDIMYTDLPYVRIFRENSLFDITPLRRLVEKNITNDVYTRIMNSGKIIFICTVCLNNGQITYFTNNDNIKSNTKYDVIKWRNRGELIESVMASSIQPVLMRPEKISGNTFVDGGLREYIPVDIAIDAGASDITCIVTSTGKRLYEQNDYKSAIDILIKTIDIFSMDIGDNDLRLAKIYNDGINYIKECKERIQRTTGLTTDIIENLFTSAKNPFHNKRLLNLKIIRPAKDLGGGLDFDTGKMKNMFAEGYNMNIDLLNIT